MGIAFVLLRLSPPEFWAMSPLELSAALEALGVASGSNMRRNELQRLMQQFPDDRQGGNEWQTK
jgi:uncharacterized phage protein (TIGR02216 family)